MPIKILMPALSPTMTSGNIIKWIKNEGDKVVPGDVIAEIETDKAIMEIESTDEGIIAKILIPANTENVPVNSIIAILFEDGESEIHDNIFEELELINKKDCKKNEENTSLILEENKIIDVAKPEGRIFASPLARRIAYTKGLDLREINGSGPHGRIVKSDVVKLISCAVYKDSEIKENKDLNSSDYRLVNNSNMRKVIAKRLLESKTNIPHFYISVECFLDKLLILRADVNKIMAVQGSGKVSINDFIVLASALSLKDVPEINASWDNEAIKYYNKVNISIAVSLDGGLITPIIKDADTKDVVSLSLEIKNLVKKAHEGKLLPEEFSGGSFSISNLGMYGVKNFHAIINPPQACILAVGECTKRPVVIEDEVKISNIIDITLSCDHRVVDGVASAKFLATIKSYLENPVLMFLKK